MPLVAWSPKTQASRAIARAAFVEVEVQALGRGLCPRAIKAATNLAKTSLVDAFLPFVFGCQRAFAPRRETSPARRNAKFR